MEDDDDGFANICNELCTEILTGIKPSKDTGSRFRSESSESSDSDESGSDTEENNETETTSPWSRFDSNIEVNPFLGKPGVQVFPTNSDKISDVVDLFIGDDFFHLLVTETNKYYRQVVHRYRRIKKTKRWKDTTVSELKQFFGLNILMGQIRKNSISDYWSTDPHIETPIFSKVMTRNRFIQILQALHFSDNSQMPDNASRIFKVEPVMNYFVNKFGTVYKPKRNLLLKEASIPHNGRPSFKVKSPRQVTKYGMLVRMVCECNSGYITKFKLYSGPGKNLKNLITDLLDDYKNLWHHVYTKNHYNSVELAETLLEKKIRICGVIRETRGVPQTLRKVKLQRKEHVFRRKGDVLIHFWKDKTLMRMITTIHQARLIETDKFNRITGQPLTKPESIVVYNLYANGADLRHRYLNYNPIIRKSIKWTKKVFMFMFNCALLNSFIVYKKLNPGKSIKFSHFLQQIGKDWIQEHYIRSETTSKRAPHHDISVRLSANMRQHRLVKIRSAGKKKFPQKRCRVCVRHGKRRETCFMCSFCETPLCVGTCFENYHLEVNY